MMTKETRDQGEQSESELREAKKIILKQIGYCMHNSCNFCVQSLFFHGDWGICCRYSSGHSGNGLRVHKNGICPDFQEDEGKLDSIYMYRDFIKERS